MVRNIIVYFFFFDLILAASIFVVWVSKGVTPHQIHLGATFLPYIRHCVNIAEESAWKIPYPPTRLQYVQIIGSGIGQILQNAAIWVYNVTVPLLNFIIYMVNMVINLLFFVVAMIFELQNLVDTLAQL